MKICKCATILLLTVLLFSCSSNRNNDDSTDRNLKFMLDSFGTENTSEMAINTDIPVEGQSNAYNNQIELDAKKEETLKEAMKDSVEQSSGDLPIYQEASRQVKKVERKKLLIKPLTDLQREPYKLSDKEIDAFIKNTKENKEIEDNKIYTSKEIKALIENYQNILKTSQVCCISNMTENFKMHNLSQNEIIDILKDDLNNLSTQDRCLVLSEDDIRNSFEDENISDMISKSRLVCICNNKDFLRKNINNFYRIYNKDSDFYKSPLLYKYKNKHGKIVVDDVNQAIVNMALTLEYCP